jgi:hypothetical protein
MKTLLRFLGALLLLILASHLPSAGAANATDAPNLLWHNKVNGQNRIWLMGGTDQNGVPGTVYQGSITLDANTDSPGWRMVGAGDLDGDGINDIVWQHSPYNLLAVWYMNSDGTAKNKTLLNPQYVDPGAYKMVGVADMNGDGIADLIWEYPVVYPGLPGHVIWFMNKKPNQGSLNTTAPFGTEPGDINWRISCAANLPQPAPNNTPIITWRYQQAGNQGSISFWYMNSTNLITTAQPYWGPNSLGFDPDLDSQIIGGWDVNGDGINDVIWHHNTLCLNSVWIMDGHRPNNNNINRLGL